jgi:predicted ArsR family transcriptional regulator
VVDLLQRGVHTVWEIALRLGLTRNAVRSHLLALERDGLVNRVGSEPGTRRPHEIYQLTSRAQKYLAQPSSATLSAVITAMKDVLPAKTLAKLLATSGQVLASRFRTYHRQKPLPSRVQSAARVLNSIGGAAQVEKQQDGFCILSQGCPLAGVTTDHPETCYMIEKFLAGLIHAPVRENCLRGPHPRCRFTVSATDGETVARDTNRRGSRPSESA